MQAQKRQLSEQAQVAKLCRQYCKSIGVKCSATSSSFSMGDSVDVDIENQPPEIVEQIKNELAQYKYGHFDGMNDIYEYSNSRKDIPQTKYLSVNVRYTADLKQSALDYIRANFKDGDTIPAQYADCSNEYLQDENVQNRVYRLLNGSLSDCSVEFWATQLPAKTDVLACQLTHDSGVNITIREGTKEGYSEVLFDSKPDKETRDSLKTAGFRWSGNNGVWWGKTSNLPFEGGEQSLQPVKKSDGSKFRAMADKMQSDIDNKLSDRQTNTAKRVAQAAHARLEGERLQRTQQALNAMADLIDSDNLPDCLQGINSKKAVYDLMSAETSQVTNGYHGYRVDTGKMHPSNANNTQAVALWALLSGKSDEQIKADELKQKIQGLQFSNIPGYFPTPQAVIDTMIDYAGIEPNHLVLEPSAGSGAIADAVKPLCHRVDVVEQNITLCDILKAKGHPATESDFLIVSFTHGFDRILMNPPFEKMQDVDHVNRAYHCLNDNGRLVAVMSAGVMWNSQSKAVMFREWVDSIGGEFVELPENSFKESGTGVNTCLVILDK